MEVPYPRLDEEESPLSWSNLCMNDHEREQYAREGKAMFLAMNEASKEQDSQEMNNEGMDMLLSQYYRQGRSLIEDYRSCQRAQRPPLSPPPTPPQTQQQQTHAPGRTHSHRVQKSKPPRRAQVSPRELRRLKRKAPRRPVTRSMDQGRFHQVELDPRRGKVRYWGNKWESTSAWSYHAVSYSDFLERWGADLLPPTDKHIPLPPISDDTNHSDEEDVHMPVAWVLAHSQDSENIIHTT